MSKVVEQLGRLDIKATIQANTTGRTPDGRRRITAGNLWQAITAMEHKGGSIKKG